MEGPSSPPGRFSGDWATGSKLTVGTPQHGPRGDGPSASGRIHSGNPPSSSPPRAARVEDRLRPRKRRGLQGAERARLSEWTSCYLANKGVKEREEGGLELDDAIVAWLFHFRNLRCCRRRSVSFMMNRSWASGEW